MDPRMIFTVLVLVIDDFAVEVEGEEWKIQVKVTVTDNANRLKRRSSTTIMELLGKIPATYTSTLGC